VALNKLNLDEIWWIVSLSNPLKNNNEITDFNQRLDLSERFVKGNKIKVCDIEKKLETSFTINILEYLIRNFPRQKFVWLMGVDNIENFHLWKDWRKIISKVPIAIFDRPFYSLNIQKNRSISFYRKKRVHYLKSRKLKYLSPPSWIFLTGWTSCFSSSSIKKKK